MKNKILTIIFSLAIAFGLWLYVVTYEYTQIEYTFHNIEVQLLGESTLNDRGFMLASGSEHTVDLTIYGKRSDISRLRSSDITVTVSLNNIHEAGERAFSYEVSFPGDLRNGGIEIVKRTPETIKINISRKLEKDILVEPEIQGDVPEGYVIDMEHHKLSHQTVHISGPEEWLNKIEKGKVVVDMTGRTESFSDAVRLVLCDKDGNPVEGDMKSVTVANSMINVEIPVLKRKQIQLLLPIIPGGGLTEEDVRLDMSTQSITVVGSKSVIDGLPNSVELDKIDLSKEKESFNGRPYTIPLSGNFTVEGSQSMKVYVSLFVPEMVEETIELKYEQITFKNLAEGYTASPTETLNVTIRYKKDDEAKVNLADISAVVDLKGSSEKGTYAVTFQIEQDSVIELLTTTGEAYIDFFENT